MTIENVNAVSARPVELATLVKKEEMTKINCVFDENKSQTAEKTAAEKNDAEIIYLKNSSYQEFLQRYAGTDSKIYDFGQMSLAYMAERHKESKDFKKIESGELLGKQVFINKNEYKSYIKEHPEAKENTVLLKSMKAKEFVRDNAKKLGLDVRGEYKTRKEEREAVKEKYVTAQTDTRKAKLKYKQAKAEAKAQKYETAVDDPKLAKKEYKEAKAEAKAEYKAEKQRIKNEFYGE